MLRSRIALLPGIALLPVMVGLAACSSAHPAATGSALSSTSGVAASAAASAPAAAPTTAAPTGASSPTAVPDTASTGATASSPADGAGSALPALTTYTNARFGFAVQHPIELTQQAPPTDGDGLSWRTGGTSETAFGDDNVNQLTPAKVQHDAEKSVAVTYTHVQGDRVVVSGLIEGGFVVSYELDVVGPGSISTLIWRYAATEKATWDPLVTATADSFSPGDVSVGH